MIAMSPTQVPALQWSGPVHLLPSSQALPFGLMGCEQRPVFASHKPGRWQSSNASQITPAHWSIRSTLSTAGGLLQAPRIVRSITVPVGIVWREGIPISLAIGGRYHAHRTLANSVSIDVSHD